MHPTHPSKRRRREFQLGAELLETRELLTSGGGDTFAIIPGAITTAGQTTTLNFTIDPTHFTIPKDKLALGIDVAAASGSTVTPMILSVNGPNGRIVPETLHSIYDPSLLKSGAVTSLGTTAVVSTLKFKPASLATPQTYSVTVMGTNKTTGQFELGFYLPGDANGDGVVNQADITAVKAALHSKAGATNYSFDADANRDGRIGAVDLKYAQENMGVETTISPVISANLDQSTDPLLAQGVTTKPSVNYTGTVSPDATVTFQAVPGTALPVTTTADSSGNYKITVPLVLGSNTFQVTTLDGFSQSISGTLAPVTYTTNTSATTSAALATLASLGSGTTSASTSTTTS